MKSTISLGGLPRSNISDIYFFLEWPLTNAVNLALFTCLLGDLVYNC